jgi:hypothetical protein
MEHPQVANIDLILLKQFRSVSALCEDKMATASSHNPIYL